MTPPLSLCPHPLLSPVPTFIISARASKSNELVRTRRVGPKWRVSSDISLHGRVAPMTCTLDRTSWHSLVDACSTTRRNLLGLICFTKEWVLRLKCWTFISGGHALVSLDHVPFWGERISRLILIPSIDSQITIGAVRAAARAALSVAGCTFRW